MSKQKSKFLQLLGRQSFGEEIIIRTDSIVEVWKHHEEVVICYNHPKEDRIVEYTESFDADWKAVQRFYMVMRALGCMWQFYKTQELGIHTKEEDE